MGYVGLFFKTFSITSLCGTEFNIKDSKDILAGSLCSCSTMLYSLCFINFKNLPASISVTGSLIGSLSFFFEAAIFVPSFSVEASLSFAPEVTGA